MTEPELDAGLSALRCSTHLSASLTALSDLCDFCKRGHIARSANVASLTDLSDLCDLDPDVAEHLRTTSHHSQLSVTSATPHRVLVVPRPSRSHRSQLSATFATALIASAIFGIFATGR
jgi:hypothetical protein